MDHRIKLLIVAFESYGWASQGPADIPGDWWFTDIILLVSVWRPVGTKIYITLLNDPAYTNRKVVWAVSVSALLPTSRDTKFIVQLTLNELKTTDLDAFVKSINKTVLEQMGIDAGN